MAVGLYSGVSGLAVGVGLYQGVSGLWGGASGLINGFGGSGPFPGASLYLDFLTPPLDSRITFSRGTNATLVDSTGKITYAPNNLVQQSEAFDNVYWARAAVNVTADATTAPNGTLTADKVFATATTGIHGAYANITLTATTHIYSCYAKAAEYSLVRLSEGASGRFYASFNLSNGTVVAGTTGGTQFVSASIIPVGDGWYRCAIVFTGAAGAYAVAFAGYPAGATLNIYGVDYTGDGVSGTFFWGAQLEQVTYQTTPSPYVATTASAYYGPRFDYDPVTLAPRGLLIEEARTNLILRSEEFNNASWLSFAALVSADVTAAPSGLTVADKITEAAGAANQSVYNGNTAPFSTVTASTYFKSSERTFAHLSVSGGGSAQWFAATFNLTTGVVTQQLAGASGTISGATITNAGNGWYRCTITGVTGASSAATYIYCGPSTTATPTPGSFGVLAYSGTAGSGVFAWGAQLEAGAFVTSYIPTVASTVSRSADVATMTGTNFSTWYNPSEGTFIVWADGPNAIQFQRLLLNVYKAGGSNASAIYLYQQNSAQLSVWDSGGTQVVSIDAGTVEDGAAHKIAAAIKTNDFAASVDGGTVVTDTSGTLATDQIAMAIGMSGNNLSQLNGHIRAIAYYNTRLPNTQLQTLTAPSLASPLALDFILPTYTVGY